MRRVWIISLVAAAPFSAFAQPNEPPPALAAVYACASIEGEAERLACYDAAVGRLRSAADAGEVVAVDRAQAETLEREAFGFSLPNLPRIFGRGEGEGGDVSALDLELAGVERRPDGRSVFTMTNGQVWTQVEADRVRGLRAGSHVTIRRAAMGSFLMTPDNGGEAIRVRRTQ